MKKKQFSWMPASPWLRAAMQSCVGLLAINWVLQGMRGMQSKELSFRLMLEIVMAMCIYSILPNSWCVSLRITLALLLSHTLNWTFNGNLWVCVRYCPAYRRDISSLKRFLDEISTHLRALTWLDEAVCIGSVGNTHEIRSERSDIDLRLIFPSGVKSWLLVNLLLVRLRITALFRIIPLDLYAYNDVATLDRFRQDERLFLILDRANRIANRYPERAGNPLTQ